MEKTVFINREEMIGLGHYISEGDIEENLAQFEFFIEECNDTISYSSYVTESLFCLRLLNKGIDESIIKKEEYSNVENLLMNKRNEISLFLSKWDETKFLDLTDAADNGEPYEFYFNGSLGSIEVYSEKNLSSYLLNYKKQDNIAIDEFPQLYITAEEYPSFIEDLNHLISLCAF